MIPKQNDDPLLTTMSTLFRNIIKPPDRSGPGDILTDQAQPGSPIWLERIERDDDDSIIYLDAGPVVAFAYLGEDDTIVLDLHRRSDEADQRLRVLLDEQDVALLPLDASRSATIASKTDGKKHLNLVCGHCDQALTEIRSNGNLQALLIAAASHVCQQQEAGAV